MRRSVKNKNLSSRSLRVTALRSRDPDSYSLRQAFSWRKFWLGQLLIFFVLFAGILGLWVVSPVTWQADLEQHIVIVPKNIDVSSNVILFLHYRSSTQELSLTSLPAAEEVRVAGGYGRYPLKSVYPLLMLDKKKPSLVRATYSYALRVPVDQVWVSSDPKIFTAGSAAELSQDFLSGKIEAALSIKDRWKLSQIFRVQGKRSKSEYATLLRWHEDKEEHYAANFNDCRVGILNTTSVPGLGGRLEDMFKNTGAIVVRVSADTNPEKTSKVLIQPGNPACQALLTHLPAMLPATVQVQEDPQVFTRGRSELELVVGEDLAQFLNQ
jgi:hypothetical protein